MNIFKSLNWFAIQQPLILMISMFTGRSISEILKINVHDRLILAREILIQTTEVVTAGINATSPTGAGGVTLTEDELNTIIDEANDIPTAVDALIGSFTSDADPA